MKDGRPPCEHDWAKTADPAWAKCTKCGDEYTWEGLKMEETVDTTTEPDVLDTTEIKAKLRVPSGQEHYDIFRAFVAERLAGSVVSSGIVMCITLACADIERGVDGFTGKALGSKLTGLPPMAFHVMTLKVLAEFPAPFGVEARRIYDEALRGP